MDAGNGGGAYIPRRKRRRAGLSSSAIGSQANCSIGSLIDEASAEQEASWVRQEQGIVVEGDHPIPPPILSFDELALSPDAISVLRSRGVTTPSAVQAQALPCIFQGRDVVALAPTGSGKTLCYILPLFNLLQRLHQQAGPALGTNSSMVLMPTAPCALVIVPTRELVDQVVQDLAAFFPRRTTPPVVGVCGGIAVVEQLSLLQQRGSDVTVLVATPGRLLHLAQRHGVTLSLGQMSLLVVDEVDRVLETPEMEIQLREILQLANSAGRQTLLCSATLPVFLPRLARSAVLRPVTIYVDVANIPSQTPSTLSSGTKESSAVRLAHSTTSKVVHDVQFMRAATKQARLLGVLRATKQPPVLVFCNTRSSVECVTRLLQDEQFHVAPLHGGQSQGYRTQALRAFRAGYVDVLVATDVASRGLDFPDVGTAVLFDIPNTIEDYMHRCGRVGRHTKDGPGGSDAAGKVTSFLTRECTIAMELKQVLLAARQSVPRELNMPRIFQPVDTLTSEHKR
uniref:RNA helicase n=1 Tax=Peronospora matthiolae TaxID=2874970 RepID=A0AAV1V141_9STRA